MKPHQSLVEDKVVEFTDAQGNEGGCKVTIKPMSTRDAVKLLPGIIEASKPEVPVFPLPLMEAIFKAAVVNVEAPDIKFRPANPGAVIDYFTFEEVNIIIGECVNLIHLPDDEKKT